MLIINSNDYENPLIKLSFGQYKVTQNGKKRNGEFPFISFKYDVL